MAWTFSFSPVTSPRVPSTSPSRITSCWRFLTMSSLAFATFGLSTFTITNCPQTLTVAPQFLPHSLRIADLAANQLMEIYPLTFGEKPELRSVYLHDNQLTNTGLPFDAFHGSEAVTTLILSSNQLSYLPPSLPSSLVRLHLQNNQIAKVPRGALGRQSQLRELYLQHNRLSDAGLDATTFSKLKSLEYLDLSNNRLGEVPEGLPSSLVILHLGRNQIHHVPAGRLSGARGLQYLLLQHNPLGPVGLEPAAFQGLRGLHTLHLYANGLEEVPPGLPRHLRALMLPHNRISKLGPQALVATPFLVDLNLAHNRLTSAHLHHLAFCHLGHLQTLDLAGNRLTLLPQGLPGSLQVLRLPRNQVNSLDPEPMTNLSMLQELHLGHNRLRVGSIMPGTWQEVPSLKVRACEGPKGVVGELGELGVRVVPKSDPFMPAAPGPQPQRAVFRAS
uniref:Podocan like 1 n=1 Tax=Sarcophilus harrisii TaxID=9305 RepID=G3W9E8_SARHA